MDELANILPNLRTWAKKFSGSHYDPDDLVTDVIIRFLQRPDRYNPSKGPLRNYLFSCIRNQSWDALRAYNRKGREKLREHFSRKVPTYVPDDQQAAANEFAARVERQINLLPKRLSEPMRLFAIEGKKYREIAELLGIREGYAKCLIHRARVMLRAILSAA